MSQRLISLDVFRGMAIAGMILVNNPGSWAHVYPPLLHAEWDGFTPTDLVFPAFLFIAGVAMSFSLRKYLQEEKPTLQVYQHILKRCALLFLLGLFLNGFGLFLKTLPNPDLTNIRILGVLQRISLAYLFASFAVLKLSKKALWLLCGAILISYWAAMSFIPVPEFGPGNLTPEGSLAGYIDRLILTPQHSYKPEFDPEGVLSTLPSIATVLLGYFTGDWLRKQPNNSNTSIGLLAFGIIGLLLGSLWGVFFPINKQLWTSSYVLFSGGWCCLLLAACYELIEVRKIKRWSFPFQVMGLNAIFVFVVSGFFVRILYNIKIPNGESTTSLYNWIYITAFEPWAGSLNGSLLFAIASVAFWWTLTYFLYRKNWFLKL